MGLLYFNFNFNSEDEFSSLCFYLLTKRHNLRPYFYFISVGRDLKING